MIPLRKTAGAHTKAFIATVASLALVFVGGAMSVSAAPAPPDTGFNETNAGVVKYQPFAPTEVTRARQVNAPMSQKKPIVWRASSVLTDKPLQEAVHASYRER